MLQRVLSNNFFAQCLTVCLLCTGLNLSLAPSVYAQSSDTEQPTIDPNLDRRDIREFDIDSENVELGVFVGIINIEDFDIT